jgi:hypothetical protein
MRELVFLLEEPSAKAMLESLLPRMLKEDTRFRCIPFEGKQDLEKQLTRRIRAYQNERARFIVLRDQDALFRSPDRLGNPSKELEKLTSGLYQKVSGSRAIGEFLDLANERSPSFRNLVAGIRRMEAELLVLPGSSGA